MKKILTYLVLSGFALLLSMPVLAQAPVTPPRMQTGNAQINLGNKQPVGMGIKAISNPNASVGTIVSNAINILYIVGGLATIIYFLWGAFDWITAGGDKEKIGSARKKIIQSLVGLALLAASFFIIALVGQIVGYNPLKTPPLPRLDNPV